MYIYRLLFGQHNGEMEVYCNGDGATDTICECMDNAKFKDYIKKLEEKHAPSDDIKEVRNRPDCYYPGCGTGKRVYNPQEKAGEQCSNRTKCSIII